MRSWTHAAAAAVITTFLALPAFAGKSTFYDMGRTIIKGNIAKPAVMYVTKRERIKWERLLRLKKSLKETLIASGRSPVLK